MRRRHSLEPVRLCPRLVPGVAPVGDMSATVYTAALAAGAAAAAAVPKLLAPAKKYGL